MKLRGKEGGRGCKVYRSMVKTLAFVLNKVGTRGRLSVEDRWKMIGETESIGFKRIHLAIGQETQM